MDLIDIYKAFYPKAAEYTFFSNAHETFFRREHMLGHKESMGKYKKVEISSSTHLRVSSKAQNTEVTYSVVLDCV